MDSEEMFQNAIYKIDHESCILLLTDVHSSTLTLCAVILVMPQDETWSFLSGIFRH